MAALSSPTNAATLRTIAARFSAASGLDGLATPSAMISTTADPTTAPSLKRADSAACSGVRMPNPVTIGRSVCLRMVYL